MAREERLRLAQHGRPVVPAIHQGTQGNHTLFLGQSATHGVQVEVPEKLNHSPQPPFLMDMNSHINKK